MRWIDWVTLAIAIIGAALGMLNAWQGWSDRRVRLRVIPKYAEPVDGDMRRLRMPCISIEVQNLGAFPVTIEEVGLLIGNPKGDLPRRLAFPPKYVIMGPTLPHRLERHDSLSLVVPMERVPRHDYSRAYARAAAGGIVQGNSPVLKQLATIIARGQ